MDQAVESVRGALADRSRRRTIVTGAALLLITGQLAFRAWAAYGGWFFGDDLIFLSDVARKSGTSYFQLHDAHFMPLGRLLVEPVAHLGPFNWHAAAAEIIALQLLANLTCWWMLKTLFGNRLRILVPLAWYLLSPISIPALMWWAAGLNMLAVQPAIFVAITAHVLHLRTGRKRYLALASLALVLGLCAYEKAVLIPPVLVVVTICYFARGSLLIRAWAALRNFWLAWLAYGVITVAYLLVYFSHDAVPTDTSKVDYGALAQNSIVASLGTGLLGGPWRWAQPGSDNVPRLLANPSELAQIFSWVVLLLFLGYVATRFRGALKPLYFLVPYVLISAALIAIGRVSAFGSGVTMEVRYWTDFIPYASLAAGLMIMPLLDATDPLILRDPPVLTVTLPRGLQVALTFGFVLGSIYSTVQYVRPWHSNYQARAFLGTTRSDFTAMPGKIQLADQIVPEGVMPGITFPYNLTSYILAPLGDRLTTPTIANDIGVLNGYGQIVSGLATPDLDVPQVNLQECLNGVSDGVPNVINLGAETYNYPFWASVTYRADEMYDVELAAGKLTYRSRLSRGLHVLSFRTAGSFDHLTVYLPRGAHVCVDSIHIGKEVVTR